MSPLSSPNATALMVLQQTAALEKPGRGEQAPDLVAIANGISSPAKTKVQSGPNAVHPVNDMFSVMSVDINKMKINLMERLGEKLGISFNDFETASEFGREVQRLVNQIKLREDGALIIKRMEHELGLDKLGVSMDEFIQAIIDPESHAAEKLDAALLREAGGEVLELIDDEYTPPGQPRIDELGIYSYY